MCVGGGGAAPDTPLSRRAHGHSSSYNGGRASLPLCSLPLPAVKRGGGCCLRWDPRGCPPAARCPGRGRSAPGRRPGRLPPPAAAGGGLLLWQVSPPLTEMASMAARVGEAAACGSRGGKQRPSKQGRGLAAGKGGSGKGKGDFREEPSAPTRSLAPLPPPGASGWCGALALCFKFQVQPRPLSHNRGFYRSLSSS